MQVSVEKLDGLERRMTVQVPAEEIDQEIQNRLRDLTRKVKIHGFRPGKVPYKVVKRMYGPQVRKEVLGEVMQSSFQDAIEQEKLRPTGRPQIEPKNMEEGHNMEYSATFEVLPDFELQGIEGLKVERPIAEVTESDIDNMLETLRKQRVRWNDTDRSAQEGDRVTITFEGKLDGEGFPGHKGEHVPVVIGDGAMLKDFEERLIGSQSGNTLEFDMVFPNNYHNKTLADKQVHFTVAVEAVAEPQLPEINDEFIASFDIKDGDMEAFRAALKENMERELSEAVKIDIKRQVMQGLIDANDIPLPQAMVNDEVAHLAKQSGFPEDSEKEEQETTKNKLFEAEARRRVALGLIIARLVSANDIKVDNARVYAHLETIASRYQDQDVQAVMQVYQQNPQLMESIRNLVLEDQVVDWLLERAEISDKPGSFDDVMKPQTA